MEVQEQEKLENYFWNRIPTPPPSMQSVAAHSFSQMLCSLGGANTRNEEAEAEEDVGWMDARLARLLPLPPNPPFARWICVEEHF